MRCLLGWLAFSLSAVGYSQSEKPQVGLTAPLAYEMSAYELAPDFRQQSRPWSQNELRQAILQRIAFEKQRKEMDVYYYRIGYTMSFPLALAQRPTVQDLPAPLPKSRYPWLIWLTWDLEERWRLLHTGWREFGDAQAGALLQRELAALSGWDHFCEVDGNVGLVTGHIAASLSLALTNTAQWEPEQLRQTRNAAEALIERDVWPWFEKRWPEQKLSPNHLVNIPVIALVRGAQLARVIGSPRAEALEGRALEVLRAWCEFRVGKEHHTEGTAYDGYLMDSITEWLGGLPTRPELLRQNRQAFRSLADYWIGTTLPGRPDLHAPLGDVEPEMTFWANALVRLGDWCQWQDADWLLRRVPLPRLRAAALISAWGRKPLLEPPAGPPNSGPVEHPNAVTLRTGWDHDALLAVMGLSRGGMGHLHADGGQLILGWQGRFWVTDPGYQQYRPGEEREYTLGVQAHNAPVINGVAQTMRAARLLSLETKARGCQHARADLSDCYRGLRKGASIQRDVWVLDGQGLMVAVRDTFSGLATNAEVSTSWQGGHHLGWAFRENWARLSDGQRAIWFRALSGTLEPSQVTRHAGSRGPLTLTHTARLPEGQGACWWLFCFDQDAGWTPPSARLEKGALEVETPEGKRVSWSLE